MSVYVIRAFVRMRAALERQQDLAERLATGSGRAERNQ